MRGGEAIFETARSAVVFALGFSSEQYGQSPLAKLQRGCIGAGKGLVGMDGAGQAGMVLAEIARLDGAQRSAIIARFSPRFEICPCCGGQKPLEQWQTAVEHLAWVCVPAGVSNHRVRRGLVAKFFGASGIDFVSLGEQCNVHRKTVAAHYQVISKKLQEVEASAQTALYAALQEKGMVSA